MPKAESIRNEQLLAAWREVLGEYLKNKCKEEKMRKITWGPWRYDPKTLCLTWKDRFSAMEYEVDLERCTTAGDILDWVGQINRKKKWGTPEVLGYLVQALDDLLHLQSNILCLAPGKSFDVRRHLRASPVGSSSDNK